MTHKSYRSEAFEAIHQSAQALFRVGVINKTTLREFDAACLSAPPTFEPEQIRALREQCQVSQGVFARLLNTSVSTVQKWESGAKRPGGLALKLLDIVSRYGAGVLAQEPAAKAGKPA